MNMNEALMPLENSFLEEVVEASGVDIRACYQCQKCSAGCPVVTAMDILPNQVIRQIQYGRREK
ncbi:MAG: heterodisulfide reductase subunit C, partial [Proteobacteria bacterium]|nr:heterodisulfide reductase subunit C [Pseudomonadota bacterium]